MLQAARLARMRVPPSEMFLPEGDKYSKFDENVSISVLPFLPPFSSFLPPSLQSRGNTQTNLFALFSFPWGWGGGVTPCSLSPDFAILGSLLAILRVTLWGAERETHSFPTVPGL